MAAKYGWVITQDFLEETDQQVFGPYDIPKHHQDALIAGDGLDFRMYDDDGNLYYQGRVVFDSDYQAEDMQFEPLTDFGMPYAGCTEIRYLEDDNQWRTL